MEKFGKAYKNLNDKMVIIVLFILSVIVRSILSNYCKTIYTYNDDLFYYQMAENFASGRGLFSIYNAPMSFYKCLYSIMISPAFLFYSRNLQRLIVAILNSLYMSSAIFPIYLMAKQVLSEKKNVMILCIMFCIFPDLTLTMTFMSEVVFLPMALWLIYGYFMLMDLSGMKAYLMSIFLGVLTFVGYMCKELAPVFLIAYVLCTIVSNIKNKSGVIKNDILKIICAISGFLIGYFIVAIFIVKGNMSSYTGKTDVLSVLDSGHIGYMIYSLAFYIITVAMVYCFFGFFMPLFYYKKFDKKTRRFYSYNIITFILVIVGIAYSISAREDYGSYPTMLRFRYFTYIWIPFLIVFIKTFEIEYKINKKVIASVSLVYIFLMCIMVTHIKEGSTVDHLMLEFLSEKDLVVAMFKCAMITGIIIGIFLLIKEKKRILNFLVLLGISLMFLLDTFIDVHHNLERKSLQKSQYQSVKQVEDFIKETSTKSVGYLCKL